MHNSPGKQPAIHPKSAFRWSGGSPGSAPHANQPSLYYTSGVLEKVRKAYYFRIVWVNYGPARISSGSIQQTLRIYFTS